MPQEPIKIDLKDYQPRSLPRRLVGNLLCAAGLHRVPNFFTSGGGPEDVLDGFCARQDCRKRVVKRWSDLTWTVYVRPEKD
jgi:hypothetical protein